MRIALGTAQFGMAYGIANVGGRISFDEAAAIVTEGRRRGLDTLDTAIAYGESEKELGEIGVSGWRVVSKLAAAPAGCTDLDAWVFGSVRDSLARLRLDRLDGLLLHQPAQLVAPGGDRLYAALERVKAEGLTAKIGVSVYDPSELDALAGFTFDLVQAPFNVFDRRLLQSGWMARLAAANVEIHIRSVFLQGLLLAGARRPKVFDRWQQHWTAYERWLMELGQSPLQACLGDALSFPALNRIVVGVDSCEQFAAILDAAELTPAANRSPVGMDDLDLLNPFRWGALS